MNGNEAFKTALAYTLTWEGGYSNRASDRGGETFRGVSRRNWPRWQGWPLIDKAKAAGAITAGAIDARLMKDPTMGYLVEEFYRNNFWAPVADFGLPGRLTGKLFDTSVNCGLGAAVTLLQRAVGGLAVDGKYGPKTREATLGAVKTRGEGAVLTAYCREQLRRYNAIVARDPSQGANLKGWTRRAAWVPQALA